MRKSASHSPSSSSPTLGMIVPSVCGGRAGDPKVVIIVGATHGATAGYRADADVAYAEARKYTSNVVKVYSPNATWAKVKAAVVGASIVIYMGHGNGWPSPYTYDPQYTTKDGFGPQRDGRGGRLQQQVLRRAVHGEPGPRARRDRAPPSPVLRVGQLRARATPNRRVTVARQRADNYADGLPEGRGVGRHRRRPRRRRELPARAVHDPSVDRGHVADRCRTGTATSSRSRRCGRPASPSSRIRVTPTSGF